MYNSRLGRRTRRVSDSKLAPKLRDRRFVDADDDDDNDAELGDMNLTPEEIQGLLELLPYKEALIKIAKGEFEIEKVEEVDEDEESGDDEAESEDLDNFEEDENLAGDEDSDSEDEEDYEDFEEDEEETPASDSANTEAWRKRLAGNNK